MAAFMELGMLPELADAVTDMGWSLPTDIQQEGIPAILGGADVLMAAETGSGKTGAFCLPIIQIVWETMRDLQAGKVAKPSKKSSWRMNLYDRDASLGVNDTGLICQSTHPKKWSGVRAELGVTGKGKYYFEAKIDTDGLCRMGWATSVGSLNLGTDGQSYAFGGTGKKSHDGQFEDYGESFTRGDVIGCLLDLDSRNVSFSKNGKVFPAAYSLKHNVSALFPAILLKNATLHLNFGAVDFAHNPPPGYVGVAAATEVVESPNGPNSSSRPTKRPENAPLCIILEPTKELTEQTHDQITRFSANIGAPKLRSVLITGGIPISQQMKEINAGCDIATATPGRIRDLIQQEALAVSHCRFFILDETDSFVTNNDALRTVRELHSRMPSYTPDGQRLQMVVCSATLHNAEVKRLSDEFMHFPLWVDLKGRDTVPDTVHQVVCMVDPKTDKSWIRLRASKEEHIRTDGIHLKDNIRPGSSEAETLSEAVKVLKMAYLLKAIVEHKMSNGIIFCRTKLDCDNTEQFLEAHGHSCVCLHSDRGPAERTENLKKFRDEEVSFLICTDVAARGLDVRGVPFVFNMTLPPPDEKANYLHRIGRVGRAERMGLAISLVATVPEKVWFHQCKSRGTNCSNTNLVNKGGCAKWFDEVQYLSTIEEHMGVTVAQVENDFAVPVFEYDGKVVYGGQRSLADQQSEGGHAVELAGTVKHLVDLERDAQFAFLNFTVQKV